jgi:L-asparaginase
VPCGLVVMREMVQVKSVLLLTTGGTIAAREGGHGLKPGMSGNELLDYITDFKSNYNITVKDILHMDSSNIQAEEWHIIARTVMESLPAYDGVVITHGTDTMAYTSSMLCFMLMNLNKPVVLTGAQMPIYHPLTDARNNLYTAFAAVDGDIPGVSIAFRYKIINGCRAGKVRTMGFEAFESINAPYLGEVFANGLRKSALCKSNIKNDMPTVLRDNICPDVFLLKLIPGTKPDIFDMLLKMNYRGVVLETFGAGGVNIDRGDFLSRIQSLVDKGVAVVACSQCAYEPSVLSIYEVGTKLISCGVISGMDMTAEAAVTKLMWALGQTDSLGEVRNIFNTCYAGEVTLPDG